MFFDEERTKFFDYITTVIPIINSSNSADKLKEELEIKGYSDLNVEVIDSLAFFIDDMRLLKNIVNEYAQYREKLDEKLDQNKLLAMIVYKTTIQKILLICNKGKGVLYDCLHKKSELLVERNRQIDERINGITKKLQSLEATHAIQEKELRLIYIEGYRRKLSKQNENNAFLFLSKTILYLLKISQKMKRYLIPLYRNPHFDINVLRGIKLTHIMVLDIIMIHLKIVAIFNSVK